MNSAAVYESISRRIDAYENAMIKMQYELTAIPAMSPDNGGDGEFEKVQHLLSCLHELKFPQALHINAPDDRVSAGIRPNLIVHIPGRNPTATVWILTHTDIVPPGEIGLWNGDPYKCHVIDGKIFGRGTEDNQQDLIASIFAAKAVLDEGEVPENSIGLAFVADEETASRFGLSYVLHHEQNPFRKADIIVVPDSGNEDGTMIEIAEKSILWLRIKTIGRQCHASRPDLGKNALQAASQFIVVLNDLYTIFNAYDPFYEPRTSTFEPTKKESNIQNINTIPGEDIFYMDCRILPHYQLKDVLREIRNKADEIERRFNISIEITPVQDMQAPPPTPHDAPVVNALQKAVNHVYGVHATPQGIGAGTVAAVFRSKNYPVAVWSRVNHTAHQPNENCLISNMIGNAKVYAHLFMQSFEFKK